MRRFLHLCLNRTPVLGLLVAALLFRALIPTGFMPTVTSDGTIVMELCSGFTTKTVVVHLDADSDAASHAEHAGSNDVPPAATHGDLFDQSPCGFAVAATAAGPPDMRPAIAPVSQLTLLSVLRTTTRTPPSIHRSQTPRGPPLV